MPTPYSVTVKPYTGDTASARFGTPVTVTPVYIDDADSTQLVMPNGAELRDAVTIYAPVATVAPPWSLVTLPDGTVVTVGTCTTYRTGGLDLPEHVKIVCGQT